MNLRVVDVTEVRSDRSGNIVRKMTVTPVLERITESPITRDDISATLNYESIFDFQKKNERTPLQSEQEFLVAENELSLSEEDFAISNPPSDMNEQRITLLSRKYAAKNMLPEDAARLDILTQRFRNLMPSITEKDLEIMEGLNKQIENAIKLNDRLKEKYK